MNPLNLVRRLVNTLGIMCFYETRGLYDNDAITREREARSLSYHAITDPEEIGHHLQKLRATIPDLQHRLNVGDRMIALMNVEDLIVSYGWMTDRPRMWISELGVALRSRGNYVLYDFYTPEAFQRNGFYALLLRSAASSRRGSTGIIYALQSNEASNGAIRKIGFRRISAIGLLLAGRFSFRYR